MHETLIQTITKTIYLRPILVLLFNTSISIFFLNLYISININSIINIIYYIFFFENIKYYMLLV